MTQFNFTKNNNATKQFPEIDIYGVASRQNETRR